MVVVRLSRGGAKRRPFFNIVVTDKRNRRDGSFIERLGFYNPQASEKEKHALRVDLARIEHWKAQGAQVSPTVARLVRDFAGSSAATAATDVAAVAQ
jgi:small subunit ribosomal protein S16